MKEKAGYYISNLLTAIVNLRELSTTVYKLWWQKQTEYKKNRHGLQTSSFSGVVSLYEVFG